MNSPKLLIIAAVGLVPVTGLCVTIFAMSHRSTAVTGFGPGIVAAISLAIEVSVVIKLFVLLALAVRDRLSRGVVREPIERCGATMRLWGTVG